ncbi:MAG TPA: chromate efflux transporter [Dongiaceae bacterium]|jgi:chromate transporter|nr:chromate efflux transporter [Dongiaceae bacterium]
MELANRPDTARIELPPGISLSAAFGTWVRIALLSFGGPAGQIAVMHRILVTEKKWIGDERFLHALSYCMLLPGPEAQQLATYIGWLMHGVRGGVIAGLLFVAPGLISIMALSWIYVLYGHVPLIDALFIGLKAAVLAIVIEAVLRVGKRALKNRAMIGVALLAFLALALVEVPFPVLIVAAALLGWGGHRLGWSAFQTTGVPPRFAGVQISDGETLIGTAMPDHTSLSRRRILGAALCCLVLWLAPVALLLLLRGPSDVFSQIAIFFSKMAVVTFGGAYAVLAYVAQQAVEIHHWLMPGEMLDGLGLAETTPGPLIMVLQFVGFLAAYRRAGGLDPLLAGTLGGLLATWVTFTPCFLWIFLGAPYIERLRSHRALTSALGVVTASVVGVIFNLAVWFAFHTLFRELQPVHVAGLHFSWPVLSELRIPQAVLALFAFLLLFGFRLGILSTLALCALLGMACRLGGFV